MKNSITVAAVALGGFLAASPKLALGQWQIANTGWQAESVAAPATFAPGGGPIVAWMGSGSAQHVWYSALDMCGGPGCPPTTGWSNQKAIAGSQTTASPALSQLGLLDVIAWKGPKLPADSIYYSFWSASGFAGSPNPTVCDSSGTCAQTIAAPAAAANGYTLYLAFTTASDTIQLATYTATGGTPYGTVGTWSLSAAVPGAFTTAAPALAVYNGTLFLAWVAEGTTQVNYATLSLSGGSWTAPAAVSGSGWTAQTEVSPALAAFVPPPLKGISQAALYMAWTTVPINATNTINFASWNGSAWVEWNPPIPIPPGPLTILSPALMSQVIQPPVACDPTDSFLYVGYTAPGSYVYLFEIESLVTPPPPGALKGCVPE